MIFFALLLDEGKMNKNYDDNSNNNDEKKKRKRKNKDDKNNNNYNTRTSNFSESLITQHNCIRGKEQKLYDLTMKK